MEPWYKVVTPRKEVSKGRSFNPDEFAIHLEQVAAGKAPDDYQKPDQFFARTVFTRALREHTGLVLKRLAGETAGTSPVLTLITQFGGGKTHTLTTLFHLANEGKKANALPGLRELLDSAGLKEVPQAKVGVFVGNAWDPQPGRDTPWIDLAWQLAGAPGVAALGESAKTAPPGTDALGRLFAAAGGRVLVLFDEVLNFLNRHRKFAEPFHAFLQNLTVAMTATQHSAAVISLPRSQVEMTESDQQWQDKIAKVVRRVAKDLIVNDEGEVSEVLRRRLFDDLGDAKARRDVAREYADWCFERRAQLPPEWTAVDTGFTDKKAQEFLRERFERCYPFHPATISVFQRKWQSLPQYQQTRGTLAMLAQWVCHAYREDHVDQRRSPLLSLGSAPLEVSGFRSIVLGQLGESRLNTAIEADLVADHAHAKALDADAKGKLRSIHRKVGVAILFECSGGQSDKAAHLPELRFALGEPGIDTTSIDSAAAALESRAFYLRKVGGDGFRIGFKPKLNRVAADRRSAQDYETDVRPEIRKIVEKEFRQGSTIAIEPFPADSTAMVDASRLSLVIADPEWEWTGNGGTRARIAEWTRQRGKENRLRPGALVWCVRSEGRNLRDRVEQLMAWRQVERDVQQGVLGAEFEKGEKDQVRFEVKAAEDAAREEVWASYRYVVVADRDQPDGIKALDIGAGHASGSETLCGRVLAQLKSEGLLEEGTSASWLERRWPKSGPAAEAWSLQSLRKAFLDGSLTRLVDPDRVLKAKIPEMVERGELGLASGQQVDGSFERVWFAEPVSADDVTFEANVFLLRKARARQIKAAPVPPSPLAPSPPTPADPRGGFPQPQPTLEPQKQPRTLALGGSLTPEVWNRVGTKLLPKLRTGVNLQISVRFSVDLTAEIDVMLRSDLEQILRDLGIEKSLLIEP
ncbi:MAG: DUF499 domain-containing protein [Planctomycetota bacterium]